MSKKFRKNLAIILAFTIALTGNISVVQMAFAAGTDDTAVTEQVTEATAEQAAEDNTAEAAEAETAEAEEESETAEENTAEENTAEETGTEESEPSKKVYTAEAAGLEVTATLNDAASVPDDASLEVTEITNESEDYNYAAYMEALNSDTENAVYNSDNTILLDVAFIGTESGEKIEYQPEGGVTVKVQFTDSQLSEQINAEDAEDIKVIHLPLKDGVKGETETTASATDIEASDVVLDKVEADVNMSSSETVEVELDSLSGLAIIDQNGTTVKEDISIKTYDSMDVEDIVGDSLYYGITANTWDFDGGDAETSMAVGTLNNKGAQNGSNDSKSEGSNYQYWMVGELTGNDLAVKGYDVDLTTTDAVQNGSPKITTDNVEADWHIKSESEIKKTVSDMVDAAAGRSETYAGRDSFNGNYSSVKNATGSLNSKITLDFTDVDDGTIYIDPEKWIVSENWDGSKTTLADLLKNNGAVIIKMKENQKLVFNYTGSDTYEIGQYVLRLYDDNGTEILNKDSAYLADHGTDATQDALGHVIFNAPKGNMSLHNTSGIFLAPNGTIEATTTCGGWAIADKMITKDEWHFTYSKVKKVEGEFEVTKELRGENLTESIKNKEFTFTIRATRVDAAEAIEIPYTRTDAAGNIIESKTIKIEEGKSTGETLSRKIKAGETYKFTGIPEGATIVVIENEYTDYTQSTQVSDNAETAGRESEMFTVTQGTTETVKLINEFIAYGNLTVRKELKGNDYDTTDKFKFKVTLKDEDGNAVSGTFDTKDSDGNEGKVTFDDKGIGYVTVTGNGNITIHDLPKGVTYEVVEDSITDADGKTITYSDPDTDTETGTISSGATQSESFVNTNNTYGKLKVEKSVKGNGADTDKSFKFTVKLTGASSYGTIKATYTKGDETGDIEFAADDYSCEFELKDGESITIDGLPTGVKYTVTEDDYSDDGYTTTSTGETGTIAANGTKTSKFVNTYSNTSSVKITKKLEGNDVSGVTDPFTIYITMYKADGTVDTSVDGEKTVTMTDSAGTGIATVKFEEGVGAITLVDGQTVEITDLPVGDTYKVNEEDYSRDGYEVSYVPESDDGESGEGTVQDGKSSSVRVVNTRNKYGALRLKKLVAGNDKFKKSNFWFRIKLTDTTGTVDFTKLNVEYRYSGSNIKVGNKNELKFDESGYSITPTNQEDQRTKDKVDAGYFRLYAYDFVKTGKTSSVKDQVLITGIPVGVKYEIVEWDYTDTYDVSSKNANGTIAEGVVEEGESTTDKDAVKEPASSNEVSYTNTRNKYEDLSIEKRISGNDTDFDEPFTFSVYLKNTNEDLKDSYSGITFTEVDSSDEHADLLKDDEGKVEGWFKGTVTITGAEAQAVAEGKYVQSDSSITIKDLPKFTEYVIVEETGDNPGYTTSSMATQKKSYYPSKDTDAANAEKQSDRDAAGLLNEGTTVIDSRTNHKPTADEDGEDEEYQYVGDSEHRIIFTNSRNTISLKKTVEGTEDDEKEFDFTVKLTNGADYDSEDKSGITVKLVKYDADGNVVSSDDDTVTFSADDYSYDLKLKAGEKVEFQGLADGVKYEITEGEEPAGYTLDEEKTVNETGKTGETDCNAEFVNTYSAKTQIDLSALKTLYGRDLEEGEFQFDLRDWHGEVIQTKSNDADGTITFDTITFTKEDMRDDDGNYVSELTREFTVREKLGDDETIIYDPSAEPEDKEMDPDLAEKITVTLVDDGEGNITATIDRNGSDVEFTNEVIAGTSVQFEGIKELYGTDNEGEDLILNADDFQFLLYEIDEDGNEVLRGEASNDGDGYFSFDQIDFTGNELGDVHNYVVRELIPESKMYNGVKLDYDDVEYKITVKLVKTDDGKGIRAKTTVTASNDEAQELVNIKSGDDITKVTNMSFVNSADVEEGETIAHISFNANKKLVGRDLRKGEFLFAVFDEDGDPVAVERNDADGNISFAINYDDGQEGEHKYTIKEVEGYDKTVKYDDTVGTITVKVVDYLNEDGEHEGSAEIIEQDFDELTFINTTTTTKVDTGDDTNLTGWILCLVPALAGLAWIAVRRRRAER